MFHPIANTRSSGTKSYAQKAPKDTSKKEKLEEKSYYFSIPSQARPLIV